MGAQAKGAALLALLALLALPGLQARQGSVVEHLQKSGNSKFLSLLGVLGLNATTMPANPRGTLLVPSDAALAAFAKDMGLTEQELAARPHLVDLIVSYHFLPGYTMQNMSALSADPTGGYGISGDRNYAWRIFRDAKTGKSWVMDVQGNNVTLGQPVVVNQLAVVPVDKVLRSGGYFASAEQALSHHPQWSAARDFAKQHGSGIISSAEDETVFVPDNAAFKAQDKALSALSPSEAADLLRYHVVKPAMRAPVSPQTSQVASSLQGHAIKLGLTSRDAPKPFSKQTGKLQLIALTPEAGPPANVTVYNIYAGKSILHGINGVLKPKLASSAHNAAAAAAAPTQQGSGSKPAAAAAAKPAAGSKPAAAVPQAAAASKPPSSRGRRLLAGGSGRGLLQGSWVGTQEPAYNAAATGMVQGYPIGAMAAENAHAALTAASEGYAFDQGAGWDPMMAPPGSGGGGCYNCGFF